MVFVRRKQPFEDMLASLQAAGLGALDSASLGFADDALGLINRDAGQALSQATAAARDDQEGLFTLGGIAGAAVPLGGLFAGGRAAMSAMAKGAEKAKFLGNGRAKERFLRDLATEREKRMVTGKGASLRAQLEYDQKLAKDQALEIVEGYQDGATTMRQARNQARPIKRFQEGNKRGLEMSARFEDTGKAARNITPLERRRERAPPAPDFDTTSPGEFSRRIGWATGLGVMSAPIAGMAAVEGAKQFATPENAEWWRLRGEDARAPIDAATVNSAGFGANVSKAVADWLPAGSMAQGQMDDWRAQARALQESVIVDRLRRAGVPDAEIAAFIADGSVRHDAELKDATFAPDGRFSPLADRLRAHRESLGGR
jgi:hypothetical protein